MSSDSDTSSYYTIFSPSGESVRDRLFSPPVVSFPWNELYHNYTTIAIFIYSSILNSILAILLAYSSSFSFLDENTKKIAEAWSTVQILITFIMIPLVFKNVLSPFENFGSYVGAHYVIHLILVTINVILVNCYKNVLGLFFLWSSTSLLALICQIFNKYNQNKIKEYFGY
jgi:accessory gene regulator protein AgrB